MIDIKKFVSKNSNAILMGLEIAGIAATALITNHCTVKALENPCTKESKKDKALYFAKHYWPVLASGAATAGLVIFSHKLSARQIAGLTAALGTTTTAFKDYRKEVVEEFGEEKDKEIVEKVLAHDIYPMVTEEEQTGKKELFYEPFGKTFFEDTQENVILALMHANRNFCLRGDVTVNEYRSFLNIEPCKDGDTFGWAVSDELDGYYWLDFRVRSKIEHGRKCKVIFYDLEPIDLEKLYSY